MTGEPRLEILTNADWRNGPSGNDGLWLTVVNHGLSTGTSQFVELRYSADPAARPLRPFMRLCFGEGRFQEFLMPAPTDGCGIWFGRLASGWVELLVDPGEASFRLESVRPLAWRRAAARLLRNPKRLFFAMSAALVGLEEESALNWRWALGREPRDSYLAWRSERQISQSHGAASDSAAFFELFLDVRRASVADIEASCEAIQQQSHKRWRVSLVGAPADVAAGERLEKWAQEAGFQWRNAAEDISPSALVCLLAAGDVLHPSALATFASYFDSHPEVDLAYSDELRRDPAGGLERIWRPGWSPTLLCSVNYLGRAFFARRRVLGSLGDLLEPRPDSVMERLASRLVNAGIGSIPRPLFTVPAAELPPARGCVAVHRDSSPPVTIVIPTRDRADLLEACLGSLFARSTYKNYEVALVDNDSSQARTLSLFERLTREQPRLKVVRSPGPFNFSALCNAGAAAGEGEYLVFLNNDTCIDTDDWIERLLYFAAKPDVGAVGAKLLFPDRTVQHVGVVIGLGGVAGHFGAGLKETEPGWMGRNLYPHDVSAVTAACLMIGRAKFEAVGKFDAENLPVDLNDIDLCLRLRRSGLRNICHSQTVLIHHQSASRGRGLRLQRVYAQERRIFLSRWRSIIRDDPYFNPGLSLYANEELLP